MGNPYLKETAYNSAPALKLTAAPVKNEVLPDTFPLLR